MIRKISVIATALLVSGCFDSKQREYDIRQAQHERGLEQIMGVYDMRCSPHRESTHLVRNEEFCDGLREAYRAIQSDRNLQGFPDYEKLRESKNSPEPSTS